MSRTARTFDHNTHVIHLSLIMFRCHLIVLRSRAEPANDITAVLAQVTMLYQWDLRQIQSEYIPGEVAGSDTITMISLLVCRQGHTFKSFSVE
ncbi:MAG: hypothetical protein CMJ81_14655 [Planctomycetaceae bacterium]|nr:hypothetical protein [Planctomycetaceae bacterium]